MSVGGAEKPSALQQLGKLSLAYATADVLAQAINFLLTPLYLRFLSPEEYGALALLLLLSTFLKIAFRLGLDSGFLRIYYDVAEASRARFAGTVAIFSAVFASSLFALVWVFSTPLSHALFESAGRETWIRLVAADILASSFVFVPFSLLRIEGKASLLSTYSLTRHLLNTVLKVGLVVSGYGVTGALLSDAVASAGLSVLLLSELRTRAVPAFDWPPLWSAMRFGLPKVPHGVLAQTLNLADRRILEEFVSLSQIGVYSVGSTFASAMKFPLSAFEPAWQPFVFEKAKTADGPREIAAVATRVAIVFTVVALGLALLLPDVLLLMSHGRPEYHDAASVVPVVILGILFQGFFFLSSVGISITKEARYYPMVTAIAAFTNISLNFLLIPRFGIMAAAWATVAGYATSAAIGAFISRRLFPLQVGWSRILPALAAAVVVAAVGLVLGEGLLPSLARLGLVPVFAAGVWRIVFADEDRTEMRRAIGLK